MISIKTLVNVADNSGARKAECIKVLRSKYQHAKIGDSIIVAIKTATPQKKVKRHDVRMGVIIRMKKRIRRTVGTIISFGDNAIVIVDKRKNPIATRLFGPVAQELRIGKYTKILSVAASVI